MGCGVDSFGVCRIHGVCMLVFWGLGDHVRLAGNVGEQLAWEKEKSVVVGA